MDGLLHQGEGGGATLIQVPGDGTHRRGLRWIEAAAASAVVLLTTRLRDAGTKKMPHLRSNGAEGLAGCTTSRHGGGPNSRDSYCFSYT